MPLGHDGLVAADLASLQCLWYGAAPMSAARLEEAIGKIGPVMAQLFGQTEVPMMISMMAPDDHFNPDGSIARERLSSAGRPAPLVTLAIMDGEGRLLPAGERGEIVVRSSLVMAGYYKNPSATQGGVPAWLASHRRHRLPRRSQFPLHRRPREGHNQDRRVQRLLRGSRAGAHAASRHPGLRGDRPAGRQVGRARHRRPADSARPGDGARCCQGIRQGADRQRQDPEAYRDLARPARSKVGKVLKNEIKAQLLSAAAHDHIR